MSTVRWHPAAVPPAIYGSGIVGGVAPFAAITAGTLTFDISGVQVVISTIDLSTATTFADVASLLQTEIRTSLNPQLATCLVQYETNRGLFIITGAVATPGETLSAVPGGVADISTLVGWSTGLQVEQIGAAAQTSTQAVSQSADEDDNFGSFAFTGTTLPVDADIPTIAAWNHAQNNKFIYCVPAVSANAASLSAALVGFSGTALTLVPGAASPDDHAETIPAEILASTNYNRPAASQNYMFYRFGNRAATVNSNANADLFDGLRVNYIGQTQTAGTKIAFYQKGFLMGDATAALDMTVYAGEMWLKDAITSTVLGGFLALPGLPANSTGRITLLSLIQGPIDQALANGVISVGKTLDATQKTYITQITANADAWRQVESKGYWIDAAIIATVESGVTVYTAQYVLVYGKNDQIRKVTGSDILI
ncbi:hypothetical protein D3C80_998050 [compost metagenome]